MVNKSPHIQLALVRRKQKKDAVDFSEVRIAINMKIEVADTGRNN